MTSLHFIALHTRIMQGNKPPLIATAILAGPYTTHEAAETVLKAGGFPRRAFVQTYKVPSVEPIEAPRPALMTRMFGRRK